MKKNPFYSLGFSVINQRMKENVELQNFAIEKLFVIFYLYFLLKKIFINRENSFSLVFENSLRKFQLKFLKYFD